MKHLHIENLTINIGATGSSPALGVELLSDIVTSDEKQGMPIIDHARPAIGEYWPGQGGIYAGDFRGDDGRIYGLIVSPEQDAGRATWGANGERDLSNWDGLENTRRVAKECPAAKLASEYTRDEHSDFYLPARRELQLAGANLHDTFGTESWYWTSTPYAEHYAWAVGFKDGYTNDFLRDNEFRVHPVRRFIY
ncbi:Lcl C-terminal domain-containing protein [Comamonas sediminis]|uniref:DUF1566 domain-containing protein n=1 Tax=Comamonas sediminis TaxID=1783360 RepID=A0ABV4B7H4_9BURK